MDLPLTAPGNDPAMHNARLTDRRKGVTQFTVHIPDADLRRGSPSPPTTRARWSTLEFRIYAVVFAIVVPLMVWVPYKLSDSEPKPEKHLSEATLMLPFIGSHPNYINYAYRLSDGWMPGRKVVS